jgi:hypothetical protein
MLNGIKMPPPVTFQMPLNSHGWLVHYIVRTENISVIAESSDGQLRAGIRKMRSCTRKIYFYLILPFFYHLILKILSSLFSLPPKCMTGAGPLALQGMWHMGQTGILNDKDRLALCLSQETAALKQSAVTAPG